MITKPQWEKTTWEWCADYGKDAEETQRIGSEMMNAAMLRISALEDALEAELGFIERYSDVIDGDYGMTEPNQAMRIASWIERVLA